MQPMPSCNPEISLYTSQRDASQIECLQRSGSCSQRRIFSRITPQGATAGATPACQTLLFIDAAAATNCVPDANPEEQLVPCWRRSPQKWNIEVQTQASITCRSVLLRNQSSGLIEEQSSQPSGHSAVILLINDDEFLPDFYFSVEAQRSKNIRIY